MSSADEDLSQFDISKQEIDKLVAEVIRYVLFKTHQNSGCPIKREELTQLVTRNYNQRNLPSYVINAAKEKLSSIFGYELRELHRSRPLSTKQGRSSQVMVDSKSYVIISQLPADIYKKYVEDVTSSHLTGFAFVAISIVHLAGGKLPEATPLIAQFMVATTKENLWHHLKRMGLSEAEENHPVLGNVKQALETLVQQRYLQKEKVTGPEGNTVFYELAERALDGPVSERIKQYISQIVKRDTATMDI